MTAIPAVPSEPPLTGEAALSDAELVEIAQIRLEQSQRAYKLDSPSLPWAIRFYLEDMPRVLASLRSAREEIAALRGWINDTDEALEAALGDRWSPDRPPAKGVEQLAEERDRAEHEADTWWRRSDKQVDVIADLTAERDKARPDREAAKARLHPVLHELDVRITDLPGDCHCNLVAEVILDALYGREGQTEEGASRGE